MASESGTAINGLLSRGSTNYWERRSQEHKLTFNLNSAYYVTGISIRGPSNTNFVKGFEVDFVVPSESSEYGQSASSQSNVVSKLYRSSSSANSYYDATAGVMIRYVELPYPVLASSVSIKPKSVQGSYYRMAAMIHGYLPPGGSLTFLHDRPGGTTETSFTYGEHGSAGTISQTENFNNQLFCNNIGLHSSIVLKRNPAFVNDDEAPEDTYDIKTSGSVAWITSNSLDLATRPEWVDSTDLSDATTYKNIIVTDGAHLAFDNSLSIETTELRGDDSSAIHFIGGSSLITNGFMSLSSFFDETASLSLSGTNHIIEKTTVVLGKLDENDATSIEFGKKSGSSFVIASEANVPMKLRSLKIHENSNVYLLPSSPVFENGNFIKDDVMPLSSTSSCDGRTLWMSGFDTVIDIDRAAGLYSPCGCAFEETDLSIGGFLSCGKLLPIDGSNDSSFKEINIGIYGKMAFFPTSDSTTLKVTEDIFVGGTFIASTSNSSVWEPSDSFTTDCDDFTLGSNSVFQWEYVSTDPRKMYVNADSVSINGLFYPGESETTTKFSNLNSLTMSSNGSAVISIDGIIASDIIDINGKFHFRTNMLFKGSTADRVDTFTLRSSANVLIMSDEPGSYNSYTHSQIHADDVVIGGKFKAQRLTSGSAGWVSLEIDNGGSMEFGSAVMCNIGKCNIYLLTCQLKKIN